jgi:hypothetical protein
MFLPFFVLFFQSNSLLSIGYSLEELIQSSEECRKIRESRRANMKGNNIWANKLMIGVGTAAKKGFRLVGGMNHPTRTSSSRNVAITATQPRIKMAKSA